jgi:hypothetical protein
VAELLVEGEDIVVKLRPLEILGALRGNFRVPRSAVRAVRVSENPWSELRGIRAPGTGLPGVIALGTRRGRGGRDFTAVYRKRPAVVVDLEGAVFDRLVLSVDNPQAVAARLGGA